MKLDILAFGVHPDDVELGCSGTIMNAIAEGKKVGIIDLTQGELGTRGTIQTRYVFLSISGSPPVIRKCCSSGYSEGHQRQNAST